MHIAHLALLRLYPGFEATYKAFQAFSWEVHVYFQQHPRMLLAETGVKCTRLQF